MSSFKLSVVMPAYREAPNIEPMYQALLEQVKKLGIDYEFLFVDDCSPDNTLEKLRQLHQLDPKVRYLSLAANSGEQKSLVAGLSHATGDAVITMDSDLQHPPECIPIMVEHWRNGHKIVIMKRKEAGHSSPLKKTLEILFYKLLILCSDTPIFFRFSGFCLMDRMAVDAINRYQDADPFLRGVIANIGFKPIEVEYSEHERLRGQSNYNLLKLIKLAVTGFTSFSAFPLYLALYLGLSAVAAAFLYLLFAMIYYFVNGNNVPGWMSIIGTVIFLGGVQLVCTGILGVYISKIFIQTKNRPLYILKEKSP